MEQEANSLADFLDLDSMEESVMSPIIPRRRPSITNRVKNAPTQAKSVFKKPDYNLTTDEDSQCTYFSQAELFCTQSQNIGENIYSPNDVLTSTQTKASSVTSSSSSRNPRNKRSGKSLNHQVICELETEVQALVEEVSICNGDKVGVQKLVALGSRIDNALNKSLIVSYNASRSENLRVSKVSTTCEVLQQQVAVYLKAAESASSIMTFSQRPGEEIILGMANLSPTKHLPDLKCLLNKKLVTTGTGQLVLSVNETCRVHGSLTRDGTIRSMDTLNYKTAEDWSQVYSSASHVVTRAEAYSKIEFRGRTLLSLCNKVVSGGANEQSAPARVTQSASAADRSPAKKKGRKSKSATTTQVIVAPPPGPTSQHTQGLDEIVEDSQAVVEPEMVPETQQLSIQDHMQSDSLQAQVRACLEQPCSSTSDVDLSLPPCIQGATSIRRQPATTHSKEVDWEMIRKKQDKLLELWISMVKIGGPTVVFGDPRMINEGSSMFDKNPNPGDLNSI